MKRHGDDVRTVQSRDVKLKKNNTTRNVSTRSNRISLRATILNQGNDAPRVPIPSRAEEQTHSILDESHQAPTQVMKSSKIKQTRNIIVEADVHPHSPRLEHQSGSYSGSSASRTSATKPFTFGSKDSIPPRSAVSKRMFDSSCDEVVRGMFDHPPQNIPRRIFDHSPEKVEVIDCSQNPKFSAKTSPFSERWGLDSEFVMPAKPAMKKCSSSKAPVTRTRKLIRLKEGDSNHIVTKPSLAKYKPRASQTLLFVKRKEPFQFGSTSTSSRLLASQSWGESGFMEQLGCLTPDSPKHAPDLNKVYDDSERSYFSDTDSEIFMNSSKRKKSGFRKPKRSKEAESLSVGQKPRRILTRYRTGEMEPPLTLRRTRSHVADLNDFDSDEEYSDQCTGTNRSQQQGKESDAVQSAQQCKESDSAQSEEQLISVQQATPSCPIRTSTKTQMKKRMGSDQTWTAALLDRESVRPHEQNEKQFVNHQSKSSLNNNRIFTLTACCDSDTSLRKSPQEKLCVKQTNVKLPQHSVKSYSQDVSDFSTGLELSASSLSNHSLHLQESYKTSEFRPKQPAKEPVKTQPQIVCGLSSESVLNNGNVSSIQNTTASSRKFASNESVLSSKGLPIQTNRPSSKQRESSDVLTVLSTESTKQTDVSFSKRKSLKSKLKRVTASLHSDCKNSNNVKSRQCHSHRSEAVLGMSVSVTKSVEGMENDGASKQCCVTQHQTSPVSTCQLDTLTSLCSESVYSSGNERKDSDRAPPLSPNVTGKSSENTVGESKRKNYSESQVLPNMPPITTGNKTEVAGVKGKQTVQQKKQCPSGRLKPLSDVLPRSRKKTSRTKTTSKVEQNSPLPSECKSVDTLNYQFDDETKQRKATNVPSENSRVTEQGPHSPLLLRLLITENTTEKIQKARSSPCSKKFSNSPNQKKDSNLISPQISPPKRPRGRPCKVKKISIPLFSEVCMKSIWRQEYINNCNRNVTPFVVMSRLHSGEKFTCVELEDLCEKCVLGYVHPKHNQQSKDYVTDPERSNQNNIREDSAVRHGRSVCVAKNREVVCQGGLESDEKTSDTQYTSHPPCCEDEDTDVSPVLKLGRQASFECEKDNSYRLDLPECGSHLEEGMDVGDDPDVECPHEGVSETQTGLTSVSDCVENTTAIEQSGTGQDESLPQDCDSLTSKVDISDSFSAESGVANVSETKGFEEAGASGMCQETKQCESHCVESSAASSVSETWERDSMLRLHKESTENNGEKSRNSDGNYSDQGQMTCQFESLTTSDGHETDVLDQQNRLSSYDNSPSEPTDYLVNTDLPHVGDSCASIGESINPVHKDTAETVDGELRATALSDGYISHCNDPTDSVPSSPMTGLKVGFGLAVTTSQNSSEALRSSLKDDLATSPNSSEDCSAAFDSEEKSPQKVLPKHTETHMAECVTGHRKDDEIDGAEQTTHFFAGTLIVEEIEDLLQRFSSEGRSPVSEISTVCRDSTGSVFPLPIQEQRVDSETSPFHMEQLASEIISDLAGAIPVSGIRANGGDSAFELEDPLSASADFSRTLDINDNLNITSGYTSNIKNICKESRENVTFPENPLGLTFEQSKPSIPVSIRKNFLDLSLFQSQKPVEAMQPKIVLFNLSLKKRMKIGKLELLQAEGESSMWNINSKHIKPFHSDNCNMSKSKTKEVIDFTDFGFAISQPETINKKNKRNKLIRPPDQNHRVTKTQPAKRKRDDQLVNNLPASKLAQSILKKKAEEAEKQLMQKHQILPFEEIISSDRNQKCPLKKIPKKASESPEVNFSQSRSPLTDSYEVSIGCQGYGTSMKSRFGNFSFFSSQNFKFGELQQGFSENTVNPSTNKEPPSIGGVKSHLLSMLEGDTKLSGSKSPNCASSPPKRKQAVVFSPLLETVSPEKKKRSSSSPFRSILKASSLDKTVPMMNNQTVQNTVTSPQCDEVPDRTSHINKVKEMDHVKHFENPCTEQTFPRIVTDCPSSVTPRKVMSITEDSACDEAKEADKVQDEHTEPSEDYYDVEKDITHIVLDELDLSEDEQQEPAGQIDELVVTEDEPQEATGQIGELVVTEDEQHEQAEQISELEMQQTKNLIQKKTPPDNLEQETDVIEQVSNARADLTICGSLDRDEHQTDNGDQKVLSESVKDTKVESDDGIESTTPIPSSADSESERSITEDSSKDSDTDNGDDDEDGDDKDSKSDKGEVKDTGEDDDDDSDSVMSLFAPSEASFIDPEEDVEQEQGAKGSSPDDSPEPAEDKESSVMSNQEKASVSEESPSSKLEDNLQEEDMELASVSSEQNVLVRLNQEMGVPEGFCYKYQKETCHFSNCKFHHRYPNQNDYYCQAAMDFKRWCHHQNYDRIYQRFLAIYECFEEVFEWYVFDLVFWHAVRNSSIREKEIEKLLLYMRKYVNGEEHNLLLMLDCLSKLVLDPTHEKLRDCCMETLWFTFCEMTKRPILRHKPIHLLRLMQHFLPVPEKLKEIVMYCLLNRQAVPVSVLKVALQQKGGHLLIKYISDITTVQAFGREFIVSMLQSFQGGEESRYKLELALSHQSSPQPRDIIELEDDAEMEVDESDEDYKAVHHSIIGNMLSQNWPYLATIYVDQCTKANLSNSCFLTTYVDVLLHDKNNLKNTLGYFSEFLKNVFEIFQKESASDALLELDRKMLARIGFHLVVRVCEKHEFLLGYQLLLLMLQKNLPCHTLKPVNSHSFNCTVLEACLKTDNIETAAKFIKGLCPTQLHRLGEKESMLHWGSLLLQVTHGLLTKCLVSKAMDVLQFTKQQVDVTKEECYIMACKGLFETAMSVADIDTAVKVFQMDPNIFMPRHLEVLLFECYNFNMMSVVEDIAKRLSQLPEFKQRMHPPLLLLLHARSSYPLKSMLMKNYLSDLYHTFCEAMSFQGHSPGDDEIRVRVNIMKDGSGVADPMGEVQHILTLLGLQWCWIEGHLTLDVPSLKQYMRKLDMNARKQGLFFSRSVDTRGRGRCRPRGYKRLCRGRRQRDWPR